MRELDLGALFATRIPYVFPHLQVERRNILNVETKQGFRARNGIKGQADYVVFGKGIHVELELKAATGAMKKAQEAWRARCAAIGVPHLVLRARRGETPLGTINRWIDELRVVVEKAA